MSSTDAAAVFSVLRSRKVSLKGSLRPLLELESGSNDPMAVFLTAGFVLLLNERSAGVADLFPLLLWQMAFGAALGWLLGRGSVLLINRIHLEYEGLYSALTLTLVLLNYGLTTLLNGNGFMAVYVTGLVMGNSAFIKKKSLVRFHDGVAWLMQIVMFLILGLQVYPSRLVPIIPVGLLAAAVLMLVARPAGVFLSLAFARISLRRKVMVSWVGLRGAVPIVLATFPLLAGLDKAEMIFNIVFFVVLTSALIQGSSIPLVARRLRLDAPLPVPMQAPFEIEPGEGIKGELIEVSVPEGSPLAGKAVVDLGMPPGSLIVFLERNGEYVVPGGRTELRSGDRLHVLAEERAVRPVRELGKERGAEGA